MSICLDEWLWTDPVCIYLRKRRLRLWRLLCDMERVRQQWGEDRTADWDADIWAANLDLGREQFEQDMEQLRRLGLPRSEKPAPAPAPARVPRRRYPSDERRRSGRKAQTPTGPVDGATSMAARPSAPPPAPRPTAAPAKETHGGPSALQAFLAAYGCADPPQESAPTAARTVTPPQLRADSAMTPRSGETDSAAAPRHLNADQDEASQSHRTESHSADLTPTYVRDELKLASLDYRDLESQKAKLASLAEGEIQKYEDDGKSLDSEENALSRAMADLAGLALPGERALHPLVADASGRFPKRMRPWQWEVDELLQRGYDAPQVLDAIRRVLVRQRFTGAQVWADYIARVLGAPGQQAPTAIPPHEPPQPQPTVRTVSTEPPTAAPTASRKRIEPWSCPPPEEMWSALRRRLAPLGT